MPEDSGRVALVVGGARGLGRAIVHHLAGLGYRVAFSYKTAEADAATLATDLRAAGHSTLGLRADATDPVATNQMFDVVEGRFGCVDVLVNNVGHRHATLVARVSDDQWRRALAANVDGAFHAIRRAAVPMVRKRFGRIVNVGSAAAVMGVPGVLAVAGMALAPVDVGEVIDVANEGIVGLKTGTDAALLYDGYKPAEVALAFDGVGLATMGTSRAFTEAAETTEATTAAVEPAASGTAGDVGGMAATGDQAVNPGAEAEPGASSPINRTNLGKQLASEQQMGEVGTPMAGPGTSTPVRVADRLAQDYCGCADDWAKMTSPSYTSAEGQQFQTHWYENIVTGQRVEFKTKFPEDTNLGYK